MISENLSVLECCQPPVFQCDEVGLSEFLSEISKQEPDQFHDLPASKTSGFKILSIYNWNMNVDMCRINLRIILANLNLNSLTAKIQTRQLG